MQIWQKVNDLVSFGEKATQPLLFLGGMLQPDQHFPPFIKALNQLGYEYHTVRYRGHYPVAEPFVFDEVIDDVAAVLAGFTKPVTLVGEALGGTIALALCERLPDMVRSCCVNGVPIWADRRAINKFSVFSDLIKANQIEQFAEIAAKEILDSDWCLQNPQWADYYREHLIKDRDASSILLLMQAASGFRVKKIHFEKITVPVLVVAALRDNLISPKHAYQLSQRLAQAKLVELDCGHGVTVEQAHELANLIHGFDHNLMRFEEFLKS